MEAILNIVGANNIFQHLLDKTFAAEKVITNESGAFIASEIQGLDDIFFEVGATVVILDDYLIVEGVASIGADTGRIAVKINNLFSRNGA